MVIDDRITWEQIGKQPITESDLEFDYRRGYLDGFIQAIQAIDEAWWMGHDRAITFMWDFWKKDLQKWKLTDKDNRFLFPPDAVVQCVYCGSKAEHLDHVFPKSRGGADDNSNLVPACARCNISKGARTPEEWKNNIKIRKKRRSRWASGQ